MAHTEITLRHPSGNYEFWVAHTEITLRQPSGNYAFWVAHTEITLRRPSGNTQAYTSKRHILMQVLPPSNAYIKSDDGYIHVCSYMYASLLQ